MQQMKGYKQDFKPDFQPFIVKLSAKKILKKPKFGVFYKFSHLAYTNRMTQWYNYNVVLMFTKERITNDPAYYTLISTNIRKCQKNP